MIVPLPVCEADPGRRLALIARATAQRKRQPPYQPSARLLQRWMVRMMSRQRLVNLLVSNVPGPAGPLFLAGAPVPEIFQFGVVQGNVTVSVGAYLPVEVGPGSAGAAGGEGVQAGRGASCGPLEGRPTLTLGRRRQTSPGLRTWSSVSLRGRPAGGKRITSLAFCSQ
jgi:hypothetical protein